MGRRAHEAAVDERRGYAHDQRICAEYRKEVTHLLSWAGIDLAHPDHDTLRSTVATIESTLYHVAGGSPRGVDADRKQFLDNRTRLGRAVQHAGVGAEAMTGIREVIDSHARAADRLFRALSSTASSGASVSTGSSPPATAPSPNATPQPPATPVSPAEPAQPAPR